PPQARLRNRSGRIVTEKSGYGPVFVTRLIASGRNIDSHRDNCPPHEGTMKRFHAFGLDTTNHCLWRGDERVALAPKAFDLLRYLVDHAERLVTQEEILGALWPDTFVNQEVVKKYVLGIRKVLGDRPDQPVFIRTFPKRGYQFIAPIIDDRPAPV